MKQILIIAGPNGAGKTTFAIEFLPNEAGVPLFVNADMIAAEMAPGDVASVEIAADREMLRRLDEHASRGDSFAFETTLSGRSYIERIRKWREAGYHVTLFFLTLPRPEIAVERVAQRVRQGGHNIPEDAICRRFEAGRLNFYQIYRHIVDAWYVYDIEGPRPIMLDSYGDYKLT